MEGGLFSRLTTNVKLYVCQILEEQHQAIERKMAEMSEVERIRIAKVEKKQRSERRKQREKRRRIEARLSANLEMAKKVSIESYRLLKRKCLGL